jgi:hypothetical protein
MANDVVREDFPAIFSLQNMHEDVHKTIQQYFSVEIKILFTEMPGIVTPWP